MHFVEIIFFSYPNSKYIVVQKQLSLQKCFMCILLQQQITCCLCCLGILVFFANCFAYKLFPLKWFLFELLLVPTFSVHNFFFIYCQAQFKSSSSSVQLGTETGLIITVRPTHPPPTHPTHPTPDKYIASTQEAEIWYAS